LHAIKELLLNEAEAEHSFSSKQMLMEDQYRSMIIKIKDSLFQNEHDTYEFLEYAKDRIPHDPADVFEGIENLEEKVNELFSENNDNNKTEYEGINKLEDLKEDFNENLNFEENYNFNDKNDNNHDNDNENDFSLNKAVAGKYNIDDEGKDEAMKIEQKNSTIDKEILDCLKNKNKKAAKDNKSFKDISEKLNYDAANVFYRMLCLAQMEKIDIIQNQMDDGEQTFVKLLS